MNAQQMGATLLDAARGTRLQCGRAAAVGRIAAGRKERRHRARDGSRVHRRARQIALAALRRDRRLCRTVRARGGGGDGRCRGVAAVN
eukprot:scaffold100460_cov57-Phaeocystis_antarctica.AAC.3